MVKFLKVSLLILLSVVVLVMVLLRYPTTAPVAHFPFVPKVDLDHLPPLKVTWIPTGYSMAWEPFIVSGGGWGKTVKMVYGSLLVEHPKGTFLIDAGLGRGTEEELTHAYGILKSFLALKLDAPLVTQMEKFPALHNVQFIFLTHSHWDHLSGAKDFPGIPIYMLPEEIKFISQAAHRLIPVVFPEHREALQSRFKPIELKDRPYENFSRSLDWFGDQSVVLVPLPGHTPGSLGIFLNVSPTKRYLVVGDALWTVNARGEPEARSLPAEWVSDNDAQQARLTRSQLQQLVKNANEITLVPVHDIEALAGMDSAR